MFIKTTHRENTSPRFKVPDSTVRDSAGENMSGGGIVRASSPPPPSCQPSAELISFFEALHEKFRKINQGQKLQSEKAEPAKPPGGKRPNFSRVPTAVLIVVMDSAAKKLRTGYGSWLVTTDTPWEERRPSSPPYTDR